MQEQIAEKQKESLSYQRELAANGSMLSQALDASRASVRDGTFTYDVHTFFGFLTPSPLSANFPCVQGDPSARGLGYVDSAPSQDNRELMST